MVPYYTDTIIYPQNPILSIKAPTLVVVVLLHIVFSRLDASPASLGFRV